LNRINSLLTRLGPAGVLGLGVLVFCVPFYFSGLRPLEQEVAAQRGAVERLRARGPFRPVAVEDRATELRRFHELFPHVEQLPGELERLFGLARGAGLDLRQGEYRLERPSAGLAAYRVTLPVRGAYPQLRNFVNAVLREFPIASIDALRFERHAVVDSQLDAQLRLTVWFQNSGDTP
jgi:hypothetical protein